MFYQLLIAECKEFLLFVGQGSLYASADGSTRLNSFPADIWHCVQDLAREEFSFAQKVEQRECFMPNRWGTEKEHKAPEHLKQLMPTFASWIVHRHGKDHS